MRQIFAVVLMTALFISICNADVRCEYNLKRLAAENALKYTYIREKTNRNDHPDIDKFLKYLGLPPRQSWCAAFVIYNFKEASEKISVPQPLPKYARVALLLKKCKENPLRFKVLTKEQVVLDLIKLEKGDLPVWICSPVKNDDFNGHIGFVLKQIDTKTIHTIEGNTTPGNTGDQREGGGVYERTRKIVPSSTFRLEYFIRYIGDRY